MARNAEKAMTALARWRRLKEEEERGPVARRPKNPKDCLNLEDAERFRAELTKDVVRKVTAIQNPGLGEYKIRDLNDEINKTIRLKRAWEYRIAELGGRHYKSAPREIDEQGREVAGTRGYKYFGAARDLPGVRELFEKAAEEEGPPKKTRAQLMRHVDADYYGYLDDDDGILVPMEKEEETKALRKAVEHFAEHGGERLTKEQNDDYDDDDIYKMEDDATTSDRIDVRESVVIGEDGRKMAIRHVVVPTQAEMADAIVNFKKRQLLDKYVKN